MPDRPRPTLNRLKQDKHVPGRPGYLPGRSVLTDPDPERLLAEWAGTGRSANGVAAGQTGSKERVDFGRVIGRHVDPMTGSSRPTTKGIIIYDRNGLAHIVPCRP